MTLTIEITSDFICPWCLVAETQLNKAIKQLNTATEIKQIWYPYELNPTMPEAGMERRAYRTNKFGSWEYSRQLDAQTIQATKNDGINFRYDLMKKTPNTLKAHRLTWLAASLNKATEMATRILNGYFTEGKDITDIDTLAKLAADIGMDRQQAQDFLHTDAGVKEVREWEKQAASRNIFSVPTIKIGREIIVGGQSVEVFLSALQNALMQMTKA
ncbi:Disulfide bond formation protein DsbA [Hyella patelloides LEGE 07179]|uniref:Disulfide bond formation protein DsbA n=1 Tax=Hyella patelloides LEGE 07179 TaxID=945734 RepID=A0A563VML6_9CYAN|nr:DsbA family oxidoreductase [Hyella patelloides]VEP12607.1 Disulfide bond formation protein DsbA [Hyella patelloides LEGE 07179]